MGTNTATVELTSVKIEKTKQRQNENSTLCCSNICCSCPVTKSFTNTNKFFNKSTNNCIKGNLYNKSINNSIKGNIYNRIKQTANNNKQPLEHLHMEQLQFLFYLPVLWLSSQLKFNLS